MAQPVKVRTMAEADLPEVRRIFQLAFGTYMGASDPARWGADRDFTSTRWRAAPAHAWVAEVEGRVVGSNYLTSWGSFGFFGPLTVLPEFWDRGVARALLAPTVARFDELGVREAALFTFSHSPKHISLYQKCGFWPGSLTALLAAAAESSPVESRFFSELSAADQARVLGECRALTGAIYPGLDVSLEIEAIAGQRLGETVLLRGPEGLEAFACCHCGSGTEAGKDSVYIKFAAVRPGPAAAQGLDSLLAAVRDLAARRQLARVATGVSLARREAYRHLLARGFRINAVGVSMHRPDGRAYNHAGAWVLDDWR
jgi:L-amino acid N-acyltransferase YncA